jgi:hypothetical protein
MTSSPSEMIGTYKLGGTMMLRTGDVLARLLSSGNDEMGRWSFQKFAGRHNRVVTIVVAYQTGAQLGTSKGKVTAPASKKITCDNRIYPTQTLANIFEKISSRFSKSAERTRRSSYCSQILMKNLAATQQVWQTSAASCL